jgi:predicted DNA-binding helix-hairpin-helix protein
VLRRAQYFVTCSGRMAPGLRFTPESLSRSLMTQERAALPAPAAEQLSLFDGENELCKAV